MTILDSVIVVAWENLRYTARCIDALLPTLHPDVELILVDNGSTDGTGVYMEFLAKKVRNARALSLPENRGLYAAANRAIESARGENVVLLHDDVVVTPGWLEGLRECMEEAPRVCPGGRRAGLVGPVTNRGGGPQEVQNPPPASVPLDEHAERHREAFRRRWETAFTLASFCLMMRREALDRIGTFDERFYPLGHGDDDLSLRMQEAGFDCYVASDVYVHHEGGATVDRAFGPSAAGRRNLDLFYDKWRERRRGKTKLVATYRVKNAAATLAESLDATARFADAIVVLDEGSTDATSAIARGHAAVTRYERNTEPASERRDRNRLLELASQLTPDWIVSIEGDEILDMDRARAERLMQLADPHIRALGFCLYSFWEPTRTYFRSDGLLGSLCEYRMFRCEPGQTVARGDDAGPTSGGVPELPDGCGRFTNVRLLTLGLDREEARLARYVKSQEADPSRDYRYLVSNTATLRRYGGRNGISLCLIAKNEAARLERFLAFFEPLVDEICLVDNGSEDATIDIARRFTDKIETHRTSRLDLAEVRNVSLALASKPWILSLDPDEEIAHWDFPALVRLTDDLDVHAYGFEIANHQKEGPPVNTIAVRLFRNDPRIRYGRAVHETIQPSLDAHPELVVYPSHVRIQHYGFLKDDRFMEHKLSLYLEANQRMRAEDPTDPMPWYNEGLHLLNDGRDDEAITFFERAILLGPEFLSPRSSLAQIFQFRALALWRSMLRDLPADHPVRTTAEESTAVLERITPPRNVIGEGPAKKRYPGPSYGSEG